MYEMGTSPYFTDVAPGEVTDLPTEGSLYPDQQEVEYPPYHPAPDPQEEGPVGGQIPIHTVQFQPQQPHYQPQDPQVVIVDDGGDINVDGES